MTSRTISDINFQAGHVRAFLGWKPDSTIPNTHTQQLPYIIYVAINSGVVVMGLNVRGLLSQQIS